MERGQILLVRSHLAKKLGGNEKWNSVREEVQGGDGNHKLMLSVAIKHEDHENNTSKEKRLKCVGSEGTLHQLRKRRHIGSKNH
eukprot:626069-Pelagomonas_calceolata.AAC.2